MAGQHRGGAAAARASAVDVLLFGVVKNQTAVIVVVQCNAVLFEEVPDDLTAQLAQVAGDNEVVVAGGQAGVPEVGREGVVGGGGRSQGCTMWKMFSVKFNAYSSPEARRF